jgi:hypothetical protein
MGTSDASAYNVRMHEELETLATAAKRLAHDTFVHVIRQNGHLDMVRLAIPAAWDADAFVDALQAEFRARDFPDVRVFVRTTEGDPRLLSVMVR